MSTTQEENDISMFQTVIHHSLRSVKNKGIRLCNKMPARLKQLDSFRNLKKRLKLFLLDHPFYSLNQFFLIFEEDNRTNK